MLRSFIVLISIAGHVVINGIYHFISPFPTTYSIFPLPSASTLGSFDCLPGKMTQTFILERSGLLLVQLALSCYSFALTLITFYGSIEYQPHEIYCIPDVFFLSNHNPISPFESGSITTKRPVGSLTQ